MTKLMTRLFIGVLAVAALAQAQSLRITSAQYGHDKRWIDVADVLNRSMVNGVLDFTPSNDFFRTDPAPAEPKLLRIEYTLNGQNFREEYPENKRVTLGTPNNNNYIKGIPGRIMDRTGLRGGSGSGLRITSARYGDGQRVTDVTDMVRSQVVNGVVAMHVDNGTMRGDPAVGAAKMLVVEYEYQGKAMRAEIREGEDLRIPGGNVAGSIPGGLPNNAGGLQIVSAQYGAGNRFVDVARIVGSYMDPSSGQLRMKVTNDTMGGDPVRGPDKILKVQYTYNGQQDSVQINEGQDLVLPRPGIGGGQGYQNGPNYGNGGGVEILSAGYGAKDRFRDVTGILQGRMNSGGVRIKVSNDTMGGDPYPGPDKTLKVDYVYQGRTLHKEVREGTDLVLP